MQVKDYKDILRKYWGYEDFRGIQRDIIESIGAGFDTLGLMPTGGGKSITFQVPAMARYGVCIVITPLIALMKDQVSGLRQRGIKATAVNSGMSHADIVTALDNCILGDYKFLYISPERIGSELFQAKLRHMRVSFITVDEAHCISQWGYDFRPSYLQIADIRRIVPNVPVLALTASATPEVVDDIQRQLNFGEESHVCRMSFERKNLTYIVRETADKMKELAHILRSVDGSAIVYTRNRIQTQELAEMLIKEGLTATNYHAGLAQTTKDERQQAWQHDRYRVMVATNAFGMGIDKPNVRLVIHYEIPDSPEAYFQEAGRAGRDGLQAWAVLLYEKSDCKILTKRVGETYPEPDYVRRVYEDVCCFLEMAIGDGYNVVREFDLQEFCVSFRHFPVQAHSALLLLDRTGLIRYTEDEEVTSRLMFALNREELYMIRQRSEPQERLIHTLLRNYPGIFAEYMYIDELDIAKEAAMEPNEVYLELKGLAHDGIVRYIPRKRTNYITFLSRRVDKDEIILPPAIYSDRRQQYELRITSMIQYVTDRSKCHSRFLLEYFGEEGITDCGRCDVCLEQKQSRGDEETKIRAHFIAQLSHGPLLPSDINTAPFDPETYSRVIRDMLRLELVRLDSDQRFSQP